jgi:hypothetical protein
MTDARREETVRVDAARGGIYAPLALAEVPRLLGKLDREPHSRTYGSFDRENWAWKFRDFPIGVLQWAGMLPLAWLWKLDLPGSSWRESPALGQWTRAALNELLRRQHGNGAFDSVGPYTQDHGASLAACYYLAETARLLGPELTEQEHARIRDSITRAVAFAGRATEDYAYISNHHALFALGLVAAAEWCDEPRWRERADETVREIISHQSADGFYEEYGGNDPGYESLGIDYLARMWSRTNDATLFDSLRRAVEYYWYAPQLDGSLGGAFGSRHSRLWFPAGFERLAGKIPEAASVAAYMRARLCHGEVVTPANVDAQNLPVMLASYLSACQATEPALATSPLPCEDLRGAKVFLSGTHVAGTDRYYAVAALQKGGVIRVVERHRQRLAYDDAGWIAQSNGRTYASQLLGLSKFQSTDSGRAAVVRASFGLVRQDQLTPVRFVVLRLLNLTVFRSLVLGNWVRRFLISRLITSTAPAPISLERELRFLDDRVEVHDTLRLSAALTIDSLDLVRAFTGIHMGSAKYFHPSEMMAIDMPSTAGLAESLTRSRSCELRFAVVFGADGVRIQR